MTGSSLRDSCMTWSMDLWKSGNPYLRSFPADTEAPSFQIGTVKEIKRRLQDKEVGKKIRCGHTTPRSLWVACVLVEGDVHVRRRRMQPGVPAVRTILNHEEIPGIYRQCDITE